MVYHCCSRISAGLRVPQKLPRNVLQGCYGATDAVIYRAAQRQEDLKQATGAPAAADDEPGCSRPLSCGQKVPGGRARKRRRSKNQISMIAPVTAAATQQIAARAGA